MFDLPPFDIAQCVMHDVLGLMQARHVKLHTLNAQHGKTSLSFDNEQLSILQQKRNFN